MKKKAYILLASGFEETEAMGTWDALIRGGVEASFVSIYNDYEVEGTHGHRLNACLNINDIKDSGADAIVLPGGMPGAKNLYESDKVKEIIQAHYDDDKVIAAICAAPLVLGRMGLLEKKKATCYPGFEEELKGATIFNAPVCVDDNIITGRGPAYALDFGVAILGTLIDKEAAEEVADGLLLNEQ